MSNEALKQAVDELNNGNFDKAVIGFDQAIKNKVNENEAMRLKAQAFFYSSKFQSAVELYQQMINKYPNTEMGYAGKARTLSVLGDFNEVQKLYKQALNLNQDNWRVYAYRGYSCTRMRKYEQAYQMYEKAITKNTLNSPISYIGRAELFCVRKNFEACRKDIKYAKQAVNDPQNHKILYRFQVEQIEDSIGEYERIMGGLMQLKAQRQDWQAEMTKQLSKSVVLYNKSIFKQFISKIERSVINASSMYQAKDNTQIIQQGAVPRVECPKCTIF